MSEKIRRHGSIDWTSGEGEGRGVQGMLAKGLMSGSTVAVLMLLAACVVEAMAGRWSPGMGACASAIAAGVLGGLLQQLWFGYAVLTKPSYPVRIAGFGLTYFAVLAACASLGGWFPTDQVGAWVGFTLTYLVVLAVITVGFTIAFRLQGASYTQRLEEYRRGGGR